MKQHIESQIEAKPTNRLKKFLSLVSNHIITSSENNLKEITSDILNLNAQDQHVMQNRAFIGKQVQLNKQTLVKVQEVKQIQPRQEQHLPIANDIKVQELQKQKQTQKQHNVKQKPSKIQEVEQFCSSLRQSYNGKVYNKDWMSQFVYNLQEINKNNAYICVQDAFQTLKQNYCTEYNCSTKQKQLSKKFSSKLNPSDTLQFNLQLTIKSRNSKHSSHFDPRDSLTYSNATSFGLPSSENRSKPSNKNDGSNKFLPPNNTPSLKVFKSSNNENDTDIPNIQRTESRGQVSGQNSRQTTPNNLFVNKNQSQKVLSENDKDKKIVEIKNEQKIHDSRLKLAPLNTNHTPVKQDQHNRLVPLIHLKQSSEPNEQQMKKKQDTNKNSIKKQPLIDHFSDRKKISPKSSSKKLKDDSIFANQISHFEDRISRIKQAKLAKKLHLQEQLKRINNQIQDLKFDQSQQQVNQPTKRQKSQKLIQKQNTFQSRIKINNNKDKKLQAINLVRNLRADKISRENQKRRKIKVLDTDLHSQIEDIMRLKYFNEERVKEKRKLEIIERMKQQQIRKIEEQKRKQESLQFLAKLKLVERQKEVDNFEGKLKKSHSKSKDSYSMSENNVSLMDKNEVVNPKQQIVKQTPTINEKKKSYISRKLNPSIKRRINENKYEQVLG